MSIWRLINKVSKLIYRFTLATLSPGLIGKLIIQIKHLFIVRYIGGRSEADEVAR